MRSPAPPSPAQPAIRVAPRRPLLPWAAAWAAAWAALFVLAPSAGLAHESRVPVAADQLEIRTRINNSFVVSITGQQPILVTHDPRTSETGLLVYGTGPDGGGTGLIVLDPALWTPVLDPGGAVVGYEYDDPNGTRGGITYVSYENFDLYIEGGGPNWPWAPAGAQNEVWFHFVVDEEFLCAKFAADNAVVLYNEQNDVRFYEAAAPPQCPAQVCGNGVREAPEVCDDGNLQDGDGCSGVCDSLECTAVDFASTYEGIQQVIFSSPVYGCDNELCHSDATTPAQGGLDLTPGNSYADLIHQTATAPFFTQVGGQFDVEFLNRVEPGEPIASMLYQVLVAKTNGNPHLVPQMPEGGGPILDDHLAAIDEWIRAGAPEDLVVEGTGPLLGACLPEPDPLKLEEPPPPPAGAGVQLQQTAWDLPATFEDEICFATYYDFTQTNLIPPAAQVDCPGLFDANNPSQKCFTYNRRVLHQDGQSHHSIIQIYNGAAGLLDEGPPGNENRKFGPFQYRPNELDDPIRNQPCDPTAIDPALGYNKHCSGTIVSTVACTSFGPVDAYSSPAFAGSQEPYVDNTEPPGVFALLPMSGVVIWNSHAFNLTSKDSTMAQYLDVYFAFEGDRLYPQHGIFDISKIFVQQVPPFETREYCKTITMPDGAAVYELGSHTHRWGSRFRIWGPPNVPCYPGDAAAGGLLSNFTCEPNCQCGPGPDDQLIYFSTEYADPVQLSIDPPMILEGAVEDRTLLYCSMYDNGSTPQSPPVKRKSTSPDPPYYVQGIALEIGGPCPDTLSSFWEKQGFGGIFPPEQDIPLHGVACMAGPNQGLPCGGLDGASFCETAPGLGDGVCDACEVMGGFTTEDEMFILLGSWFDPSDAQNAAPFLSNVAPTSALQGATLDVDITGYNTTFSGASVVSLGPDVAVNLVTAHSATDLTANVTIAANAATGFVDVTVDGVVKSAGFEIVGVPQIAGVAPAQATQGDTLDVVVTGLHTSWNGATAVSFGPDVTVHSTTVASATELTANVTVAADAAVGTVDVSVGSEVLAGGFEILQKPVVEAISETSGMQGGTLDLVITGVATSWSSASSVSFGQGVTINSMTVPSPTQIDLNVTIEPDAPPGPVDVTVDGETLVAGFQIVAAPGIVSVTPNTGQQTQTLDIVIIGTQTNWTNSNIVFIGSGATPAVNVNSKFAASPTEMRANITVRAVALPGTYDVTVGGGGQPAVTLPNGFTVTQQPVVGSIVPLTTKQGTLSLDVTLNGLGTHWDATSMVDMGNPGIALNSVNVLSPTQIVVNITTTPATPPGRNPVTVTTGAEVAVGSPGFTVFRHELTTVSPSSATQGEELFVDMTGFNTVWVQGQTVVEFGAGVTVQGVVVVSETELSAGVTVDPNAASGPVAVTVTTNGQYVTQPAGFAILQRLAPEDGDLLDCIEPGGFRTYDFTSPGDEQLKAQVGGVNGLTQGPLLPSLSLVLPDLSVVDLGTAKKQYKPAKGKADLVDPGVYQLVVSDAGGTGGCYDGDMQVEGELPRADAPVNPFGAWKIRDCVVGGVPIVIPIMPAQSATLGLKLKGKADEDAGIGPLSPLVTLFGPNGYQLTLGTPGEKIKVKDQVVSLGGEYEIVIDANDGLDGCFDATLKLK